jgi:tripartite-type tricarboxylate transporter receptor subunit TctC
LKSDDQFNVTRRQTLGILGAVSLSPMALAAEPAFPAKPIQFILPFSAGSSTDFISRVVAEQMAKQLSQPVVVENKPGAAGVIGTQQLVRSAPDGYTIGLVSTASLAMVPPTLKTQPYDSVRDLAPLTALVSTDLFMVTGPNAAANTLAGFVTWATKHTGSLFLATLGAGTSGHFAGFLFGQAAKIKFEPVHYKTFSDLMTGMVAGDVQAAFLSPSQILPHVKAGKLRALAMNGPTRLPALPDVPTFQETGYPNMQFSNLIGLAAPARTPLQILDKLSAEATKAATSPQVRQKLEEGGYRVIANSRDEFAATIRKDVFLWRDMVRTTGFTV